MSHVLEGVRQIQGRPATASSPRHDTAYVTRHRRHHERAGRAGPARGLTGDGASTHEPRARADAGVAAVLGRARATNASGCSAATRAARGCTTRAPAAPAASPTTSRGTEVDGRGTVYTFTVAAQPTAPLFADEVAAAARRRGARRGCAPDHDARRRRGRPEVDASAWPSCRSSTTGPTASPSCGSGPPAEPRRLPRLPTGADPPFWAKITPWDFSKTEQD